VQSARGLEYGPFAPCKVEGQRWGRHATELRNFMLGLPCQGARPATFKVDQLKPKSEAELLLEDHLKECFPQGKFNREVRFHSRRWRFDYTVQREPMEIARLAVEIEGGIWNRGRHTRGAGYQGDLDKYNSAVALGWRVYRFSTQDILSGKDLIFLKGEAEKARKEG
jgi:hypothetical protein